MQAARQVLRGLARATPQASQRRLMSASLEFHRKESLHNDLRGWQFLHRVLLGSLN